MPAIDDYDPNSDTQSGFGADGSSGSSSGGGQLFGGASKQHEQAYTPWSRFASANSEVSGREAGKLQQQVGSDVTGAMQGLDNANAAYNKGIQSQYAMTPGSNAQNADTQRAQGDKAGGNGAAQAFGGSQWSSFGQAPVAPVRTAQAPNSLGATPNAPSRGHAPGLDSKGVPLGQNAATAAAVPQPGPGQFNQVTAQPKANAAAVANGPQGPKDLESSMSPDAWAGLTGKVTNADAEATQLGKESGVQALLSQETGMPATGFDAALINGAGQQGFQQAAQKFGNGVLPGQQVAGEQASQDAWSKLGASVDDQRKVAAGMPGRLAADAARNQPPPAQRQGAPAITGDQPHGYPPQIDDKTKGILASVEKQNPGFLKSFGIDPNTPEGQSTYQALTDWFGAMSQGDSKMSANNEVWFNHLSTEEKAQFVKNLQAYINSPNYDGKPFPYQIPKGSVS